MDRKLLDILVCPVCKGELKYIKNSVNNIPELICKFDKLAYPVREDIPIMLEEEARKVGSDEKI